MKKLLILIYFIALGSPGLYAQNPYAVWKTLKDTQIKTKYDSQKRYEVDIPLFGSKVKALNGKSITIKGYLIPIEAYTKQGFFILSALPYNLCYFCGGAGPETVMEVTSQQKIKYTDKPIVLKGILKLNATNPNHLMYRLQNAVVVR
ncbi:hypothetical protein [Microscilla marina]|uniref:Lipoprotein n=1 Tax=Microscilla marina ATCC 23134 TaxID=313606 RepID=A1ZZ60_MICM2|nr:hypothetical protein [Microscilla marina]EAY24319.1 hypothetical protein M23134_05945 [Microscilla marina ATCC 23134]